MRKTQGPGRVQGAPNALVTGRGLQGVLEGCLRGV